MLSLLRASQRSVSVWVHGLHRPLQRRGPPTERELLQWTEWSGCFGRELVRTTKKGLRHIRHLKTDTLLLADVFENFQETCLAHYGLDSGHYYTNPGLSWDVLLKMTGVELELLTDYDKYLFFENGVRGETGMVSKRYAKANKPMVNDYHPDNPNSWILYLDSLVCKLR